MPGTNLLRKTAVLACLILVAALLPAALAQAAPLTWTKIADNGITNTANHWFTPGPQPEGQFQGKLVLGGNHMKDGIVPPVSLYTYDGTNFSEIGTGGFSWGADTESLSPEVVYKNELYIGTGNGTDGGELYKWTGSGNPTLVADSAGGWGEGIVNVCTTPLGVINDQLIVSITNRAGAPNGGLRMYKFDGSTWTQIVGPLAPVAAGLGYPNNQSAASTVDLSAPTNQLFQGEMVFPVTNATTGLEVWSYDGSSFTRIAKAGDPGVWNSGQVSGITTVSYVEGKLYLATATNFNQGGERGGEIWTYDRSGWTRIASAGIDNDNNFALVPLIRGSDLYVASWNAYNIFVPPGLDTEGCIVYKMSGGAFERISEPRFGDATFTGNSFGTIASYGGYLIVSTGLVNAAQVWATPIPPSIDSVTPTSGPYGTQITIEGHDFGLTQGSGGAASSLTVDGKTAEVLSWSDLNIEALVPAGATTGPVQVHTSRGDSNEVTFTLTLSKTWYFAEGTTRDNAVDGSYEEWLCLQNPGMTAANVKLHYMLADGSTATQGVVVNPTSRNTISVNDFLGRGTDVSTFVESDQLILAERPMYFNYRSKWTGGHDVIGVPVPRTSYYFAEGTTRGNPTDGYFEEWLCLQNPGDTDATVNVKYLLGTGQTVEKSYPVKKTSRYTVDVNREVGADQDVSCVVASDQPIVAERPMYFFYHDKWTGGHDVVGAPGTDTTFYFAEGTTRDNAVDGAFEEWICLQNAASQNAPVKITYYSDQVGTVTQDVVVGATSRLTVDVKLKLGKDVDNSLKVESTSGVPILAERPMYFNYHSAWNGGHDVMGCNAPKKSFYFAEGTTLSDFATWMAVMNPGTSDVNVTFHYLLGDGTNKEATVVVGSEKRYTRNVLTDVGPNQDVSVVVEGASEIVVERPMYFNYHGKWTGGSDTLGYGI